MDWLRIIFFLAFFLVSVAGDGTTINPMRNDAPPEDLEKSKSLTAAATANTGPVKRSIEPSTADANSKDVGAGLLAAVSGDADTVANINKTGHAKRNVAAAMGAASGVAASQANFRQQPDSQIHQHTHADSGSADQGAVGTGIDDTHREKRGLPVVVTPHEQQEETKKPVIASPKEGEQEAGRVIISNGTREGGLGFAANGSRSRRDLDGSMFPRGGQDKAHVTTTPAIPVGPLPEKSNHSLPPAVVRNTRQMNGKGEGFAHNETSEAAKAEPAVHGAAGASSASHSNDAQRAKRTIKDEQDVTEKDAQSSRKGEDGSTVPDGAGEGSIGNDSRSIKRRRKRQVPEADSPEYLKGKVSSAGGMASGTTYTAGTKKDGDDPRLGGSGLAGTGAADADARKGQRTVGDIIA